MKKIKDFTILCCLMFMAVAAQAQSISGKLVDEQQQSLAYANIVIQLSDSTFVSGTTSDEKGSFRLTKVQSGDYRLVISAVGYKTLYIELQGFNRTTDLGTLTISEASEWMDEVTVTASTVVKKIDKQIVFPTENQLKQSSSGYDLLAKLMLPDLQIDPIQNRIATMDGGGVEVRINDVKATQAQISSLRPSEVVRIEYIDNPGVRYGDSQIQVVINYIVKRQSAGIAGGIQGMNAVSTGFGNDNIYVKANVGKSEFGLDYFVSYRDYDTRYMDGYDRFTFPDGTRHERELELVVVPFGYVQQTFEASYNLTEPDKYVFNVLFIDEMFDTDKQDHSQRVVETGKPDLTFFKHVEDHNHTPALDIYYSRQLPRKQKITLNAVGTYIGTDYLYDYKEWETEDDILSHYAYSTDGKRYSLIGEGIYSKECKHTVLTAGVKGNTAYTENFYTGTNDKNLRMHNNSIYGYVQLQGKWNKLSYVVGAGIQRQAFSESDNRFSFVSFRPSVSLSYPVFKNAQLRYSFFITPYTPSLSQLSDIIQQNNNLEITRGNRDLNPYRVYSNRLTFSWNTKPVNVQLSGGYSYYHRPILTDIRPIQTEDDSYLVEYASVNGKEHHSANARLTVTWKVIPDFLTISGYGGVNWYRSVGTDFRNEYTAWSMGMTLNANYKQFSLVAGANTRPVSLYGYYLHYGEKYSYAQLTYNLNKNFSAGVACLYPFTPSGWTGGNRIMGNTYVQKKNWTHIKDNGNMFCLYFNWKFNSGRKHQSGRKTLSNSDRDSGIVK